MAEDQVSAGQIRQLRERTGIGFMACKKALAECDNDLEAAVKYLRKISGVKADGKAGRETSEGVVACVLDANTCRGVLLEVNCETDFVARSDDFTAFVDSLADELLSQGKESGPVSAEWFTDPKIEQLRTGMVQKLGENIRLRRAQALVGGSGSFMGSYLHSNRRIGALVALSGGSIDLARQVAMHVAAENPTVVAVDDVPAALMEQEAEIYRSQIAAEGKPPELQDRIIAGRLKKFASGLSLLEQEFVREPGQTVGDLLKGAGATVTGFVRFELGESLPETA